MAGALFVYLVLTAVIFLAAVKSPVTPAPGVS